MITSTMNDQSGHEVSAVLGEVFGRHDEGLGREQAQAQQRLVDEATSLGADAILAVRHDATEVGGGWQEICAYRTACRIAGDT